MFIDVTIRPNETLADFNQADHGWIRFKTIENQQLYLAQQASLALKAEHYFKICGFDFNLLYRAIL